MKKKRAAAAASGAVAAAVALLLSVVAVLVLSAPAAVDAGFIQLGAESIVPIQIGSFSIQNTTRPYKATAGTYNFTVTNSNGTEQLVELIIPPPRHPFLLKIVAWAPAFAFPTSSQACLVQNVAAYNTSQLLTPGATLSEPPLRAPRTNRTAPLGSFWGTVASIGQIVGCAYANSVTYGNADALGVGCSTPYLTMSAFTAYANAQATLWATQVSFNQNVQAWQQNATYLFETLVNATDQIRNYEIANSWAVGNLTYAVINQQSQINAIADQSTAAFNTIQGEIVVTNTNVNNIVIAMGEFATATATQFQNLTIEFSGEINQLVAQTNFLTNSTATLGSWSSQSFQQVQLNLISLTNAIQEVITQSQFLPMLRTTFTQQQQTVANMNTGGHNYQFFLDNIGTAGVPNKKVLPQSLALRTMEAALLRYIFTKNYGTPANVLAVAAFTQIELNCGGLWLSVNQYPLSSWTQIINSLGKYNCSTDSKVQGDNYCNCWIQITESTCTMPTIKTVGLGYSEPTVSAFANWSAWNNPGFPAPEDNVPFCSSPPLFIDPATYGLPGGVIRNSSDWDLYQSALCQRGINAAISGYDVFSAFFKKRYFSTFTDLSCTPNMLTLMNPKAVSQSYNVVFAIMNFFVSAFSLSTAAVRQIGDEVLGIIPLNTTIITEEYQYLGAGPTGICKTMYATAYDMNNWVQIEQYQALPVVASVTVRVDGVIYSVDDSTLTVTNPSQHLIDELDGANVPSRPGEQWRTSVYNIAYEDTISRPNPYQRLGSPMYYAVESEFQPQWPDTYNLTLWRRANIFAFDHLAGSTSWDIFYNPLICDNAYDPPKCVCDSTRPAPAGNGQYCELLTFYRAQQGGSGSDWYFVSDDDVISGSASVVTGQYKSIAGSACPQPSLSTAVNTDYNRLTINLYNSLDGENVIWVKESGACGGIKEVTLQPTTTSGYDVVYCPQEPGIPVTLTFYNFAGGIFTQCNGTVNVTVNPTNPVLSGNNVGAPFETTESLRSVSSNQALINTQQVQVDVVNALLELTVATATIMQQNYLTFAPTGNPLGPFQNVFNIIASIGQNTSAALNASQQYQFSYTGDIANYSAINAALLNATLLANEIAMNYTYQLGLTIQQAQVTLRNLVAINAKTALLVNQSQVSLDFMNAVTADIIANAREGNPNIDIAGALSSLGDALENIGGWTGDQIDKGLNAVQKIGGDFADAAKGVFGALGDSVAWIVIIVAVGGGLFAIIYCSIVCCKKGGGVSEPELAKRIDALEKSVRALGGKLDTVAAPATGGGRTRRPPASSKAKPNAGSDRPQPYTALAMDNL